MNPKQILAFSGFSLAVATALGAFGAHALEDMLTPERMQTWETAVAYQFWNTLGLLGLAVIHKVYEIDVAKASLSILTGILIFSGSLYVLCLTGISWLGAITPIGGLALITGWSWFGVSVLRQKP